MNDQLDPAKLRELFLLASDAEGARLLALVCSVTMHPRRLALGLSTKARLGF